MLYIIERTKDSYYLSCFEEYKQFIFSPLKSDALQFPKNIAERYVQKLKEIGFDEYIIIPAKELK